MAQVRLSGDVQGDYVVLQRHPGGVPRIAPEQSSGLPKVVALKKTCAACPSQWEGTLENGRTVYARYRGGALSVGVGSNVDKAVDNEREPDSWGAGLRGM